MRKFVYVLAALVAIAVIALVAVQRQQLPKTLEGLYADRAAAPPDAPAPPTP